MNCNIVIGTVCRFGHQIVMSWTSSKYIYMNTLIENLLICKFRQLAHSSPIAWNDFTQSIAGNRELNKLSEQVVKCRLQPTECHCLKKLISIFCRLATDSKMLFDWVFFSFCSDLLYNFSTFMEAHDLVARLKIESYLTLVRLYVYCLDMYKLCNKITSFAKKRNVADIFEILAMVSKMIVAKRISNQ